MSNNCLIEHSCQKTYNELLVFFYFSLFHMFILWYLLEQKRIGLIMKVVIFREVQYIYNGLLMDEDHLVQPNCSCPSRFPALVPSDSGSCQQNPGNLSLTDTVPRLNHLAHPIDFITDDDLNTFWISQVNSTVETNSIVIDFESVYQVCWVLRCNCLYDANSLLSKANFFISNLMPLS